MRDPVRNPLAPSPPGWGSLGPILCSYASQVRGFDLETDPILSLQLYCRRPARDWVLNSLITSLAFPDWVAAHNQCICSFENAHNDTVMGSDSYQQEKSLISTPVPLSAEREKRCSHHASLSANKPTTSNAQPTMSTVKPTISTVGASAASV